MGFARTGDYIRDCIRRWRRPAMKKARRMAGFIEPSGEPRHMFSIMTCPKPEQETCVAPSIRRAKS